MSSVALTGNDTLVINNQVLDTGLADEDVVMLEFPNNIANVKVGKNGNALFALNESGNICHAVIRVLRGNATDQFLNNLLSQQQANFAGTILLQGQFVKKVGDGAGNITSDTYVVSAGVFDKLVPAKTNTSGNTDQSISVYEIMFAQAVRVLLQ